MFHNLHSAYRVNFDHTVNQLFSRLFIFAFLSSGNRSDLFSRILKIGKIIFAILSCSGPHNSFSFLACTVSVEFIDEWIL